MAGQTFFDNDRYYEYIFLISWSISIYNILVNIFDKLTTKYDWSHEHLTYKTIMPKKMIGNRNLFTKFFKNKFEIRKLEDRLWNRLGSTDRLCIIIIWYKIITKCLFFYRAECFNKFKKKKKLNFIHTQSNDYCVYTYYILLIFITKHIIIYDLSYYKL